MALEKLSDAVNEFLHRKKKGKKLEAKKIRKVLERLEHKERRFTKELSQEKSGKEKKKLSLQLDIVKAHIKKARKLLSNAES